MPRINHGPYYFFILCFSFLILPILINSFSTYLSALYTTRLLCAILKKLYHDKIKREHLEHAYNELEQGEVHPTASNEKNNCTLYLLRGRSSWLWMYWDLSRNLVGIKGLWHLCHTQEVSQSFSLVNLQSSAQHPRNGMTFIFGEWVLAEI